MQHELSATIQAEQFKANLVQRTHEPLVHPGGLMDLHTRDTALDFEVGHPHRHLVTPRWGDSHAVICYNNVRLHVETDMRTVGFPLRKHSFTRGGRRTT